MEEIVLRSDGDGITRKKDGEVEVAYARVSVFLRVENGSISRAQTADTLQG
jgi:hypothetical protein